MRAGQQGRNRAIRDALRHFPGKELFMPNNVSAGYLEKIPVRFDDLDEQSTICDGVAYE